MSVRVTMCARVPKARGQLTNAISAAWRCRVHGEVMVCVCEWHKCVHASAINDHSGEGEVSSSLVLTGDVSRKGVDAGHTHTVGQYIRVCASTCMCVLAVV